MFSKNSWLVNKFKQFNKYKVKKLKYVTSYWGSQIKI